MRSSQSIIKRLCISKARIFQHTKWYSVSSLSDKKNQNVIIIGAGLAGLTAAKHLQDNNYQNVKILEASNRYGGRIESKNFGDISVELGAKHIPTIPSSNLILEDLLKIDVVERFERSKLFVTSDGSSIPDVLHQNITKAFNSLLKHSEESLHIRHKKSDKTNGKQYLDFETEILSKKLFGQDSPIASTTFNALINDLQSFYGCDFSYIDVKNFKNMTKFHLNLNTVAQPMVDTLEPLMSNQKDIIHFNKPVIKVNYSIGEIVCADGTIYTADHIICTLPLGHLKAFSPLIFEPTLPLQKIKAIQKLGCGTPENIYIQFEENLDKWFPAECIFPAWNSQECTDCRDFYKNITSICRSPHSKHVLQVNCCRGYECRFNDDIIMNNIDKFLNVFAKKPKKFRPKQILKSNWSTDPKYLGGIPYLTDINSKMYVRYLARPIYVKTSNEIEKPVLMFAGDATDLNNFGTLEGAARSGIREANRIFNFNGNKI